jgi:hypothetical protein
MRNLLAKRIYCGQFCPESAQFSAISVPPLTCGLSSRIEKPVRGTGRSRMKIHGEALAIMVTAPVHAD